ncbi:Mu transposase C-terminal domain-containing protein [Pseudomonas nitroreducens]|uniref:Mu transposase C-terminal domain-containing protein n=1 Tax=Pseudomonas nitroreducens TaxID=46680 RepID=UPI001FB7172C|nr:Mu transposase C-terminal domain-containing protein [Pseudomonas nitroreducens]MCJ1880673.1 DDE-type integrase/transposase/recombinase [Pseudomonas nitroreducens]MCJ1893989.1 DDE-type integrase/transposase/recombinase [Pseudomonas nitroreducens]
MSAIRPGALAYWRDEACIVLEIKGLTEAVIRTTADQTTHVVRATELSTTPTSNVGLKAKHIFAEDHEWDLATDRYEIIRPLLGNARCSKEDVKAVAEANEKCVTTIYRWMKRFKQTGLVSSLIRTARSDAGVLRLCEEVEFVINKNIQEHYLGRERKKISKVHSYIQAECKELGLEEPHINTIYQRVRLIDEKERQRRRLGPKIAKQNLDPLRGAYPDPGFPNAVVQIDHTPVDVILVDELHRLPIGKPFLTMSIDVETRMIGGFCLTLDPPGTLSTALCITHAVLKKDYWLAKRDISAEWPIYGLMQKIHVDNAAEFVGKAMARGCEEYKIGVENRPKGQPNYGPHIERAFRTFMSEAHSLQGTTFSSVAKKLDYDSEGKACLTLAELELWLTIFIVYVYHNKEHSGICDIPPIYRYTELVHGTKDRPGIGLPEVIGNEEKFRLNFLPFKLITVQRKGVVWDHIHYYAPILQRRIAEKGADSKGRKFIFVRDPRDISVIYFLDPDDSTYYPVPYFNANHPPISIWELREVKRRIESSRLPVNEIQIFEGYRLMREVEKTSLEKTRLAKNARAVDKRNRRNSARREGWKGVHSKPVRDNDIPVVPADAEHDDIQPFEIELG